MDAYLYRVGKIADDGLSSVAKRNHLVLQPPQRDITLGEEIAATAGGVEEGERCQLVLERIEALPLLFLLGNSLYRLELVFEVV